MFNLVDLLVMDWLIVCTITPRFLVLPGTEGMAGYKDYRTHPRGFVIGSAVAIMGSGLIAAASLLLR